MAGDNVLSCSLRGRRITARFGCAEMFFLVNEFFVVCVLPLLGLLEAVSEANYNLVTLLLFHYLFASFVLVARDSKTVQ